jgi:tRNA nucleotidyltransferase (CCA-adding enzyme)
LLISEEVIDIVHRLEDAGFETWCVGGAVRDKLLGYEGKDFDLTTAATPQQMQKLFRRTIPVGVEHGTVAILDRHNKPHEVTTFRKDVKTDGRHAEVEFGVSLDEDLARRDFTINSIAYHPLKHEWRDLFDGAGDMDAKVIRSVGDPTQRFREDYLRILRALRFAARFGFAIEAQTWNAANLNVAGLRHLSAERVREEWFRGLESCQAVGEFVGLWRAVGAVGLWLPEGGREVGTDAGEAPGVEPIVIDRFEVRDPVLITSFMSSDPAKTLARLKCSRAEIERGRQIGRCRDRWPDPESEVAVRRWMAEVGDAVDDLVCLARIQGAAEGLGGSVANVRESGAPLAVGELAVTGDDLLAAGMVKGPTIGKALTRLLDLVLEDPTLNSKDELLARIED